MSDESDEHEPEHLFRIEICGGDITYIAADDMHTDNEGVTRLFERPGGPVTSRCVAVIFPHHGLSVTRVVNLVAIEGLFPQ